VLLVSGDVARRTGGNLYDRRMERACRRAGVRLRIVAVTSTAQARSELGWRRPRVVVIDSIAVAIAAPLLGWIRRELGARVVLLMHMPTRARGTRALLRAADHIVAVGPELARTLVQQGATRSRMSVIPPGCDGIPRVARRTRKGRNQPLRVVSVANWSPAKGIANLVVAAALVPDVHLDLVGDTGTHRYRDAVRARIRSNAIGARVVVHGALSERALARRYAEADIFALPTEREGYGIVFGEALVHGLPVIAADIPTVRAIVGRRRTVRTAAKRPIARGRTTADDGYVAAAEAREERAGQGTRPTALETQSGSFRRCHPKRNTGGHGQDVSAQSRRRSVRSSPTDAPRALPMRSTPRRSAPQLLTDRHDAHVFRCTRIRSVLPYKPPKLSPLIGRLALGRPRVMTESSYLRNLGDLRSFVAFIRNETRVAVARW
jgi:glycosyltransferase involved in cell wall biosynthesis